MQGACQPFNQLLSVHATSNAQIELEQRMNEAGTAVAMGAASTP